MRRDQLEHVLRAACTITEPDVALVIGSQAILASFPDDVLPPAASRSIEVDIAFFDDPDNAKSDQVDGAIGELLVVPRDVRLLRPGGQRHHGCTAGRVA